MPRPRKANPVESTETIAALLEGFNYGVEPEDFVIYELIRLIDEDRASLDDADFRRLIDEGVRAHIEDNPSIRTQIVRTLRLAVNALSPETKTIAMRVIHALENMDADLTSVGVIVRTYTSYLFNRLLTIQTNTADAEESARAAIERWRSGEILREQMLSALRTMDRAAIAPAAELLFDSPEDRSAAATAIEILSSIRSPVSARILAHAISEPLLEEDLEMKAVAALEAFWPLPRHYMLYNLRGHMHEDIPYRWFELLVRTDEPSTVDLAIEEVRVHGDNPMFQEDLSALLDVLQQSRDPETEDKILGALNAPDVPEAARALLQTFLKNYQVQEPRTPDAWTARTAEREAHRKYLHAALLFDTGKTEQAQQALSEILRMDPDHPFACMLAEIATGRWQSP